MVIRPNPAPAVSSILPYATLFRSLERAAVPALVVVLADARERRLHRERHEDLTGQVLPVRRDGVGALGRRQARSEEHTSELQSRLHLVCRLLLEKKNKTSAAFT